MQEHFCYPCKLKLWVVVVKPLSCVWLFTTPMDCSPPGSSVHEIFQARILEQVVIPFSRGSPWPRNRTQVSSIAGRFFTVWATGKPNMNSPFLPPFFGKHNCSFLLKFMWTDRVSLSPQTGGAHRRLMARHRYPGCSHGLRDEPRSGPNQLKTPWEFC